MNTPPAKPEDPQLPEMYEIRLKGHLEARWADWLQGLSIRHEADGTTCLTGPVADQAALYGLIRKLRDLGLPLIAINPTGPQSAADTKTDHSQSL